MVVWEIAYWKVLIGVFGWILGLIFIGCVWMLPLVPTIMYLILLGAIPEQVRTSSAPYTVFWVVVAFLIAEGFFKINPWLIGFIVDFDPCAAWDAGVTGSVPPKQCPQE